jgi:hypothetical protein
MTNTYEKLKYKYRVYGLVIESEIIMNELIAIDNKNIKEADVIISYGITPKEIDRATIKKSTLQLSSREVYFYVKGIAHYYVGNGNTIIIEPDSNSNINDIKLYILGGCLGMILTQRKTVGIHGSTVVLSGKGIIICGHTGAGKSSLATALRKAGYPFLSDDISALGVDIGGNTIIHPSYPQQKLCRDTMEKMGYNVSEFNVIDASRDKYVLPIDSSFLNHDVPLAAIYEINVGEVSKVDIKKILGAEKINVVLRNIYGIEISRYIGFEHIFFKQCINIAKEIQIYKITRPKNGFSVGEQIKLIKDTLNIDEEQAV